MGEKALAALILCLGAAYAAAHVSFALKNREALRAEKGSARLLVPLEAGIFFLGSLSFPDFVLGTLFYRKLGLVDDARLPGTLVAATIVPCALISAIYLSRAEADLRTVLLCAAVEAAGSVVGSRIVGRLAGGQIRLALGVLMAAAVAVLIIRNTVFAGAGGSAAGLTVPGFALALPALFLLGAVNMVGFPMKPSSLLLLMLLGLSPVAAMTVTMTMGTVGNIFGGVNVLRTGRYQKKIALYSATAGLAGAALGASFAFSLNRTAFTWMLIAIMCFTAFSLLKKNIAK